MEVIHAVGNKRLYAKKTLMLLIEMNDADSRFWSMVGRVLFMMPRSIGLDHERLIFRYQNRFGLIGLDRKVKQELLSSQDEPFQL